MNTYSEMKRLFIEAYYPRLENPKSLYSYAVKQKMIRSLLQALKPINISETYDGVGFIQENFDTFRYVHWYEYIVSRLHDMELPSTVKIIDDMIIVSKFVAAMEKKLRIYMRKTIKILIDAYCEYLDEHSSGGTMETPVGTEWKESGEVTIDGIVTWILDKISSSRQELEVNNDKLYLRFDSFSLDVTEVAEDHDLTPEEVLDIINGENEEDEYEDRPDAETLSNEIAELGQSEDAWYDYIEELFEERGRDWERLTEDIGLVNEGGIVSLYDKLLQWTPGKYDNAIDKMPDSVFMTVCLTQAHNNGQMCEYTGVPANKLTQINYLTVLPANNHDASKSIYKQLAKTVDAEDRSVYPNVGEFIWLTQLAQKEPR